MKKIYTATPSKLPVFFNPLIIVTIAMGFGIALIEGNFITQIHPYFSLLINTLN